MAEFEKPDEENGYEGTDLEAMAFAHRYMSWIAGEIQPHLGKRILEVGAGIGSFSVRLLQDNPDLLIALEPSSRMYSKLRDAIPTQIGTEVRALNGTLKQVKHELSDAQIDTVVYINVLEHIENDLDELKEARSIMEPRAALAVYVPALPALYGPFDKRVGHFRRYTKATLTRVVLDAGFRIRLVTYRDLAGVLPWWVNAKLLRSKTLNPRAVRLYDRVIPLVRAIDAATRTPIGKNLLLIGQRSD